MMGLSRILFACWALASAAAFQDIEAIFDKRQAAPPNVEGTHGGFFYTFWSDGEANATYTNHAGGSYSVEWSGGDLYCGKGWKPGESRDISYTAQHEGSGVESFLGIYGWLSNPTVEYYIIEDYIPFNPPMHWYTAGTLETSDGTYQLFNSYLSSSIDRYWAIRSQKRTQGTVKTADFLQLGKRLACNLDNMSMSL